ncbi:MAG TPA: PKD domain-containing protein, partial [Thermoplasmata archaeon]|nr:PKD domain-containing protein [Thermoplasmata archaeon]
DSEVFVLVSSSSVTVLNSATGEVIVSGLAVGTNVTSVVFDPADDQVYAAGDIVNFIDGATLAVDGSVAPFGGPHRVLTEAYDASREAVYVASVGLLSGNQGTVSVIGGASVTSGEGTTMEVPVGEEPAAIAVVPTEGAGASGLAAIWVANELSGTISVLSTPPEVTYFAATPATIDLGHAISIQVDFTDGTGTVTISYEGLPDGCLSSNAPELNCTPAVAGKFDLVVNLTDSFGETANASATLVVMKTLSVQLTLSPSTLPEIDAGVAVVASAAASNGLPPYHYSWSFGDGAVLGGSNVSHAYSTPGAYVISAQAQDATGATANSSVEVVVVPRPLVHISLRPGNATDVDFPVQLTSSTTGGTGAVSETWGFGDGTEAVGANVTHAWTRPGTYSVTVEYVDALGVTANSFVNVTVHPSLSATFASGNGSSASPITMGSPVPFSSTASGGTPPYSVAWTFGDGSMAFGASVDHRYAAAGTYQVAVTLADSVGAAVQSNLTVVVTEAPTSSSAIFAPGGGFATGLFLGLVLGGVLAAVILFFAGPRKKERTPAPPTPYVPP